MAAGEAFDGRGRRPMSSPRPLRVLQAGPLYVNHVRRWSEHALALGCEVHVAGHVRPGRRLADFADLEARVEVLPDGLVGAGHVRWAGWLRRVVAEVRPDIVHAHWLSTWACLATFCGHCRVIATPWGSDVYLAQGATRAVGDLALHRAARVLTRSPHMRDALLARGAPPRRLVPVDLGVDLDRFRPASSRERNRIREQLGLRPGPLILSLRAGTALYNLDVVLDAFARVRAWIPAATLVIVQGDAPPSWSLRRRFRELRDDDRVRIVGAVRHAEIGAHMRAATVGISIPQSDGSPNAVWEALACGLPLVLSDLPQIAARVADSGAARLVEPSPDQVARALREVIVNQRAMARVARAWALGNLDQRDQLARLERLYRSIALPAA